MPSLKLHHVPSYRHDPDRCRVGSIRAHDDSAAGRVRAELREAVETMPHHVREPLRDGGHVQDTLDSLFEVQERLFRWRFPDWDDNEPDDFDYAS